MVMFQLMRVLVVLYLTAKSSAAIVGPGHSEEINQRRDELYSRLARLQPDRKKVDAHLREGERLIVLDPAVEMIQVSSYDEMMAAVSSAIVPTTVQVDGDVAWGNEGPITIKADQTIFFMGLGSTLYANGTEHFVVYGKVSVENLVLTDGRGLNGGSILVDDGGFMRVINSSFTGNAAGFAPTSFPTLTPTMSPAPSTATPSSSPTLSKTPTATQSTVPTLIPSMSKKQTTGVPTLGQGPPNVVDVDARPYPGVGDGGAIAALNGSFLEVTDCVFANNVAFRMGGAIVVEDNATLTVTSTTFEGNEAFVESLDSVEAGGGAIAAVDLSVVDIQSSTFYQNTAHGAGGAVFSLSNFRLSIHESVFDGNILATVGRFRNPNGGAVSSTSTSFVETDGCIFTNSKWFIPEITSQWGGALAVIYATIFTSTSDTFTNNGMIDTTTFPFIGFFISQFGGAVTLAGGGMDASIKSATFAKNSAEQGGGLYIHTNAGPPIDEGPLLVTIDDCSFVENIAPARSGGAMAVFGPQSGVIIANSVFHRNKASRGGGVSMNNVLFADSQLINTIFDSNSAKMAGALDFQSFGALGYLVNVTAINNSATFQEPHYREPVVGYQAGAFLFEAERLGTNDTRGDTKFGVVYTLINTHVLQNFAQTQGGGIVLDEDHPFPNDTCCTHLNFTVVVDADSSIMGNIVNETTDGGVGGGVFLRSMSLDDQSQAITFNGTTLRDNLPDDIHSNQSGLVQGIIYGDPENITLSGNPDLFDVSFV